MRARVGDTFAVLLAARLIDLSMLSVEIESIDVEPPLALISIVGALSRESFRFSCFSSFSLPRLMIRSFSLIKSFKQETCIRTFSESRSSKSGSKYTCPPC